MLVMGTVHASSMNGDYKGNPVVNVKVNGNTLNPEVPAQVIDGSTLLPLRAVADAFGADIKWNQDTYSVDVNIPSNHPTLSDIAKSMKAYNVDFVMESAIGDGETVISYNYSKDYNELVGRGLSDFSAILYNSIQTDATITEVYGKDGVSVSVPTQAIRDYRNGNLSDTQFGANYKIKNAKQNNSTAAPSSSQTSNPSGVNQSPPQQQNTSVSPSVPTQADAHIQICQNINNTYIPQIEEAKRKANPFNGRDNYLVSQLEAQYQQAKQSSGCS